MVIPRNRLVRVTNMPQFCKGSVIFYRKGGSREFGGGIRYFFLDQKIFFEFNGGITYIFRKKQNILLNISGFRERDCQMQLVDETFNWDLLSQCKTFNCILVLMLISHDLRRNAEGTRITLVYKVQFLCGPPSFLGGYKKMADTTDII